MSTKSRAEDALAKHKRILAFADAAMEARRANDAEHDEAGLVSRCASEIEMERVEWLWSGRLALGKHTCMAGEPGTGKSQLATAIAATLTMGAEWPCGEGKAPQGSVIILSAEDGAADTILPRLHAAGADAGRVHIVSAVRTGRNASRSFNLEADINLLEQKIAEFDDVVLVIMDPISSYLGGKDLHKNAEVRGVLEPLSAMAERTRVAVLSVTHFSKAGAATKAKTIHRFIGSIAFVGAPRMAFAVIEDPEDASRRLFLHAKNNLAPPPPGLAFRLKQTIVGEAGIVASCVDWEAGHVSMTADAALAAPDDNEQRRPVLVEAEEFLRNVLGRGAQCAKEVQRQAEGAGIASKTLRRAREKLGVKIRTDGFQGPSVWELPPQSCPSNPNDAHQNMMGKIGPDGQDWTPPRDATKGANPSPANPWESPKEPKGANFCDGPLGEDAGPLSDFDDDYPELPACLDRRVR